MKCLGTGFEKVTQSNLKIRQVRNCATYITANPSLSAATATQTLDFSSTSGTTKVITQAEIFTITGEADCGQTSCGLYLQDAAGACTSTAFATTNNQITVGASPNHDITIKRDVAAGFGPFKLCFKCTSTKVNSSYHTTIPTPVFVWKVSILQVMDCTTTLAVITPGTVNAPVSTLVLTYSSGTPIHTYTDTWLK